MIFLDKLKKKVKKVDPHPNSFAHPNRIPFEGVLTLLDVPSDEAPNGARGHRVYVSSRAAETAIPSLLGMPVCYKEGWDGHDFRQKCGVITNADIRDNKLMVRGHVFGRDFPELHKAFDKDEHGMSYEMADAHVADMRSKIWTLTRFTFTGAAILLRSKAAYKGTDFKLTDK